MKTLIINKNDAVFYLDSNGKWHNKHGEFEKKAFLSISIIQFIKMNQVFILNRLMEIF